MRAIPFLLLFPLLPACGTPPPAIVVGEPDAVLETAGGAPADEARTAQPSDDVVPRVIGEVAFDDAELQAMLELSPLPPLPADPTNAHYEDPRAERLGHWLFYDQRLSRYGDVSCATCHEPAKGWGDGKQLAEAIGQFGRHSMTLWNVAYNRWFFWDGRADTLWSQALQPLEEPAEHGATRLLVLHVIDEDPDLRRAYEETFGPLPDMSDRARFPDDARPVPGNPEHKYAVAWAAMSPEDRAAVDAAYANVGKALAAFQRRIVSGNSAFDRFVTGVRSADVRAQRGFGEAERRGLKLFMGRARCHLCHTGPLFTDREFHNNRVPPLEGGSSQDHGRFVGIERVQADPFNGMGVHSDDREAGREKVGYLRRIHHNVGEFKTPTLRNVAVTAPYMHMGQFATLEEVVRFYSTLEAALPTHHFGQETLLLPVNLSERDVVDLVAFLDSLTDTDVPPELESAPPAPYLE